MYGAQNLPGTFFEAVPITFRLMAELRRRVNKNKLLRAPLGKNKDITYNVLEMVKITLRRKQSNEILLRNVTKN